MKDFFKLWWATLAIKLLLSTIIPLSADESYYWVWSLFPQLSYFDHPPFVAWTFFAAQFLPDSLIRWPNLILFHLGFLFWYSLLKPHFQSQRLIWWFVLCQLTPLLGLGSILVLPDGPLFFFFSAAIYFFIRAQEKPGSLYFAGFGASLGLAFLSKYIVVIAAFIMMLYHLYRYGFTKLTFKSLGILLATGLLFSSPVLIWNIQNDFASFRFQLNHGLAEGSWSPDWTLSYIFGTLFLAYPLAFIKAFRSPLPKEIQVLSFLTWGGFGFFLFSSFKGSVELNWPSIFYPCLLACAVYNFKAIDLKRAAIYWSLVYACLFVVIKMHWAPALNEKLNQSYLGVQWRSLPSDYSPLYASTYQLASLIWWNSKIPTPKLADSSRYDFFDQLNIGKPQTKHFYLLKEEGNNLPQWIASEAWQVRKVKSLDEKHELFEITREGEP